MSKNVHTEAVNHLFDAILSLENKEECYRFFEDICTISELNAICQRLRVAQMLREKQTCHEISQKTKISTATISRVNKCLNYGAGGYKVVLDRLEKEHQ